MPEHELTFWGMHAGRTGDANSLFINKKVIAIGWPEMGDLSALSATRDAFKARMIAIYPSMRSGAVPVNAGQLFRFVHEIKRGDLVAYTSRHIREIRLGRVNGDYRHAPSVDTAYPHQRAVEWLKTVPRIAFSQGALYEIGSAMSLFQIKNYVDEFRAALEGEAATAPVSQDETGALLAEEVEEQARDFILKRLAQELKGHPLSHFVAHLLEAMGYRTRVSPEGPDGGIDIIAHKDELGFEPPIVKVQVKSGEGSVGEPIVSQLNGKVAPTEYGLLVTLGSFTPPAVNFARNKSNLRLIDGDELVTLVLQHYEQFDSRYKGLLPMKRVYIPDFSETD